jgi:hypothetical protein
LFTRLDVAGILLSNLAVLEPCQFLIGKMQRAGAG